MAAFAAFNGPPHHGAHPSLPSCLRRFLGALGILGGSLVGGVLPAHAGEVKVAVSSNFSAAIHAIQPDFEAATGHHMRISTGSTGKLYAQIRNGAPFGVFLAADTRRPRKLEEAGEAAPGGRFTYARGRIALWSPDPRQVDGPGTLAKGDFRHLSIANPETAPYGLAAQQTLQALGHWEDLKGAIVRGENIGQAHQFVASHNAELGFVALSQISGPNRPGEGSRWLVPQSYYDPIRQQAVLLADAADEPAARALVDYLRGPEAAEVIEAFGYAIPKGD
ncbi:molybdate ABC transporter substrate-binding protein [Thiohalorhabdus methylotrophus]|uniref:Molybdate ABC transporter substrate-binding protein n=1 Tax=Thiohalorhabdus methylotrophus TaxID=3242694 RepID=A0ABV4TUG8_9GAMM